MFLRKSPFLVAGAAWLCMPAFVNAELRVGFGVADITPAPGSEIPGFMEKKVGTHVSDPLYVVAAVFESGPQRVAVIGIDSLCIMESTVREARTRIEKETGIPAARVLVGASHTHTGGPIRPALDGTVDQAYLKLVLDGLAGSVARAWQNRADAEIAITTGDAPGLAFNRRFLMRDGREATHPGKPGTKHHGDIVRPAGPVDHRVGVLAVRRPGGELMGVLVNFGCHNTVMSDEGFSADYVGVLRRSLTKEHGPQFKTLFLLGPCGDITQIDNMSPANQGGAEYCDRFGTRLAEAVDASLKNATWMNELPIACIQAQVSIPIRPEPDVQREKPPFGLGSGPEAFFDRERQLVAQERAKNPNVSCEVQAIRLGPLGIVTNGSELFCDYGLRIKECSPFKTTWVSTLTNQWLGYVPTANGFAAGGYEPRTRRGSKLSFDAGQRLVEASLAALSRVAPATAPAPP